MLGRALVHGLGRDRLNRFPLRCWALSGNRFRLRILCAQPKRIRKFVAGFYVCLATKSIKSPPLSLVAKSAYVPLCRLSFRELAHLSVRVGSGAEYSLPRVHAFAVGQPVGEYTINMLLYRAFNLDERQNAPQKITERLRLLRGARVAASDQKARDLAVQQAWEIIALRRKSSRVRKEVWIVCANGFSASHFEKQLNKGHAGSQKSLQAYQLIQSWISTAHSNDVDLKVFVSS